MAKQSKKDAEQAKANAHKAQLAEIKANRRAGTNLERPAPSLNQKKLILIYCEGKNTEPSYFRQFRLPTTTIEVYGEGRNTLSLVERAHQIRTADAAKGTVYDEVWCVFDADPKPDNPKQLINFNEAVRRAQELGLKVAYSNQAFEYWLILHFEDHQGGGMPRTDYDSKLNAYLKPHGLTYDGKRAKMISSDIFRVLFEGSDHTYEGRPVTRTDLAIRRAERIYNRLDHLDPGAEESSTTVFILVRQLIGN